MRSVDVNVVNMIEFFHSGPKSGPTSQGFLPRKTVTCGFDFTIHCEKMIGQDPKHGHQKSIKITNSLNLEIPLPNPNIFLGLSPGWFSGVFLWKFVVMNSIRADLL